MHCVAACRTCDKVDGCDVAEPAEGATGAKGGNGAAGVAFSSPLGLGRRRAHGETASPRFSYAGMLREWGEWLERDLELDALVPTVTGDAITVKPYVWMGQGGTVTPCHCKNLDTLDALTPHLWSGPRWSVTLMVMRSGPSLCARWSGSPGEQVFFGGLFWTRYGSDGDHPHHPQPKLGVSPCTDPRALILTTRA